MKRLAACFLVTILAGAVGAWLHVGQSPEAASGKRLFIVLLDETGNPGVENAWAQSVGLASDLALRIAQDDAFTIIGIDDHAGDPSDERVRMQAMDPNPIRAMGMKRQLSASVKQLKQRNPNVKNTDILGAVATASGLASRHKEYRPVLLFLSDMDQFPNLPAVKDVRSEGIAFAPGAEAKVFFFNAVAFSKRSKLTVAQGEQKLRQTWLGVLKAAGLAIEEKDFVPPLDTTAIFNQLYPPRM